MMHLQVLIVLGLKHVMILQLLHMVDHVTVQTEGESHPLEVASFLILPLLL